MRPNKNNAAYFSHDADMRNNLKIKALRRRYSHMGYAVWCFLLESLTNADNFEMAITDVTCELLAADYETTPDELRGIIDYCVMVGLLQRTPEDIISCTNHKERLSRVVEYRERATKAAQSRWNTQENDVLAMQQAMLNKQKMQFSNATSNAKQAKNAIKQCNKQCLTQENDVLAMQQAMLSKVNKSKVKEKENSTNVLSEKKDFDLLVQVAPMWNNLVVSCPRVISVSQARKAKIKVRLAEWGKTPEAQRETLEQVLLRIEASDFLTGRSGSGHSKWVATFDWLIGNSTNWVKVLEGNYDNKRGAANASGVNLGAGERIEDGRRTYGSGKVAVPMNAKPRPTESHSWSAEVNDWVLGV